MKIRIIEGIYSFSLFLAQKILAHEGHTHEPESMSGLGSIPGIVWIVTVGVIFLIIAGLMFFSMRNLKK